MDDSLAVACVIPDAADNAFQIHCLERSAYAAVLRAFCAQSDFLSWDKEDILTELRNELSISDVEHREVLVKVSSNEYIKSLRKSSLENDSGLTEVDPAFDAHTVVLDKIVKTGQVSASSPNYPSFAQQSPMPAQAMSSSRNFGIIDSSRRTQEAPCCDPHAVMPAKKLKSASGHALTYLKRIPSAELFPVPVPAVLVKSCIDDPLDGKTLPCEVKARCTLSPIFQEKHNESNAGHVPLCAHQDMQTSRKRKTEVPAMRRSKSLSIIVSSAGHVEHGSDIIKLRITANLLNEVEKLFGEKPDPANLETAKSILKHQEKDLSDALFKLSEVLCGVDAPVEQQYRHAVPKAHMVGRAGCLNAVY